MKSFRKYEQNLSNGNVLQFRYSMQDLSFDQMLCVTKVSSRRHVKHSIVPEPDNRIEQFVEKF